MHILKKGLLTCLAMMTMSMGFLTSCSDEDDDMGGGFVTQTDAGDFDGTHLIAVEGGYYESDVNFNYLADGTLHQIVKDGEKVTFDYKTGTITFTDGILGQKARFTTNEKGYITELSGSGADEDGNWTFIYRFQYNSSDHLTNVTYNEDYTDRSSAEKEIINTTWELTWNGDLLSSVEVDCFNDDEIRFGHDVTFTYTGAVDNRYMQYTRRVTAFLYLTGGIDEFLYVGLFGKGPSKYASKIERNYNGYDYQYWNITYNLNSKGLVEKENHTSNSVTAIYYSYDGLSNASSSAADNKVGVGNKRHKNSRNHIGLFGRKK